MNLIDWLRQQCAEYAVEPVAVYRKKGEHGAWPTTVTDEDHLFATLVAGGYFLPLPKEPAALANVIEVSLVDFLIRRLEPLPNAVVRRGSERGYPDLEISGDAFGGGFHAVDIKVAKRGKSGKSTQSAITLYTGNTYFRWPDLDWPLTFRPFNDYKSHLDILAIYTLNEKTDARIQDFELIVQEPWRIASRQRSSTTREYLGAVKSIERLRTGKGEFATEDEFYKYWRKYPFKIGPSIEKQLQRAIAKQKKDSG